MSTGPAVTLREWPGCWSRWPATSPRAFHEGSSRPTWTRSAPRTPGPLPPTCRPWSSCSFWSILYRGLPICGPGPTSRPHRSATWWTRRLRWRPSGPTGPGSSPTREGSAHCSRLWPSLAAAAPGASVAVRFGQRGALLRVGSCWRRLSSGGDAALAIGGVAPAGGGAAGAQRARMEPAGGDLGELFSGRLSLAVHLVALAFDGSVGAHRAGVESPAETWRY